MKFKTFSISLILLAFIFSFSSCGKGEKPKKKFDTTPVSIKQFDTPPGADPSVSAELGGKGFKGEGWQTNTDYNILGNPKAVKGGSLIMSMKDFPATLRIIGKDFNSYFNSMAEEMMYEALVGEDPVTGEYNTPRLATHWKISDDKKTFKFRINPDARWADGKPVTSEDVIATWKLLVDPGILQPYYNELYNSYEQPVAESKYIVSVKSKQLNWRQFVYFANSMKILPAHIIGNMTGKDFLEKFQFEFLQGSGPYIVDKNEIKKGQSIMIRRRSDYWGEKEKFATGLYNFDLVRFEVIPDDMMEFEKFKKGETDVYLVTRAQFWAEKFDFDEFKRGVVNRRKIFNENPGPTSGLTFNMRKEPFNDIRVRKAIAFMYDRIKFNEKLFFNAYTPIDSYFPGTEFENPNNPKIRYNVDSSQRLLTEAGWKDKNKDGYLVKDGKIFELDLPFQKGSDRYLTIFQEDLKKVGVKLNLKEIDATTMFKLGNERNFKMIPINFDGQKIPNPDNNLESRSAVEEGTTNFAGIKNPKLDELCKAYDTAFDVKSRIKILREIDIIACNEYGYAFGWYPPYQRIAFHNKFGFPDWVISRNLGAIYVLPYMWFNDPEKALEYDAAVLDKNKTLPKGDEDNKYWLDLKEKKK
jgi:microcin C transport system substrate-binding protein